MMEFKEGDRAICIDCSGSTVLKLNTEYVVCSSAIDRVKVLGITSHSFFKRRFVKKGTFRWFLFELSQRGDVK